MLRRLKLVMLVVHSRKGDLQQILVLRYLSDFDFESKLCTKCATAKKDLGEYSCEFDTWYCGHEEQCTQTYTGSSGSGILTPE